MDLSKIKKGLFSIKEIGKPDENLNEKPKVSEVKKSYSEYGFEQAGRLGGTVPGLKTCLFKIYQDYRREVVEDQVKQNQIKTPYKVKIEDYKGDIGRLENRIEKVKTETFPIVRQKIKNLKQEYSQIRKNPNEVSGDDVGKASFLVGAIILSFLTLYLFIFYSSASYSAFFKQFSLNEIGVANSIFDAKAIPVSYQDGITELALILTIPFVFLGLGYLIHKFQENKGVLKYFKIALLIMITFIFDSILAYEITEKIYNIKKENSFNSVQEYTISMAFQSVNFWLIIFAGFVVYLIWGFVFDFVIHAYGKLDKVKVALREKEREIQDTEKEEKDFEEQINKMTHTVAEHNKEINKLQKIIESTIIPREFAQDIFHFLSGWMAWMKQSGKNHSDLDEAHKITHEFVEKTLYSIETI